jgi:hypothetical protein
MTLLQTRCQTPGYLRHIPGTSQAHPKHIAGFSFSAVKVKVKVTHLQLAVRVRPLLVGAEVALKALLGY